VLDTARVSALAWRASAVLVAVGAVGCGSSATNASDSASGGVAGSGGTRSGGTGGIVETCLVCGGGGFGGASGHAGSAASGGASGASGSVSAGTAGSAGGTACGLATCGPNQYCRAACSGVGGPTPDSPSCADMPAACNGVPSCACVCGTTASFCTPGAHEVQCGCA
jgi:hypothetical protein